MPSARHQIAQKRRSYAVELVAGLLIGFAYFARNTTGVLQTPYETSRRLASGTHLAQTIPIYLIVLSYFVWSSLVHHGVSAHPFLLTYSFGKLFTAGLATYVIALSAIYISGTIVGGTGSLRSVILPWTYSLLPTVVWFYTTSLLWFLFPPPRTASPAGQLLSFVFIAFSLFLFFWKGVLYYLTFRFGFRLGFWKIMSVSALLLPLGFLYSLFMYRLGIFRVPFL